MVDFVLHRRVSDLDPNDELYLHHLYHPNYILSTSLLNDLSYSPWRRSVEISLLAKNKLGFVTRSCLRPTSTSDPFLGCSMGVLQQHGDILALTFGGEGNR